MNDKEMEFLINIQKFNSELMELNIKNEEENERLKLAINDTYETSQELLAEKEAEINRLKKELNKHIKEGIEKDIRINKAIEYIEENSKSYSLPGTIKDMRYVDFYRLLDILQGSDKE